MGRVAVVTVGDVTKAIAETDGLVTSRGFIVFEHPLAGEAADLRVAMELEVGFRCWEDTQQHDQEVSGRTTRKFRAFLRKKAKLEERNARVRR